MWNLSLPTLLTLTFFFSPAAFAQSAVLWPAPTGQRWGYIDHTGQLKTHQTFTSAAAFSDGFAAVGNGSAIGFIDVSGEVAIPFQFEDASSFSDGLACVKSRGKWGFIDRTGKMLIPPRFDQPIDFHSGFAEVPVAFQDLHTKANFIDHSGKLVWPHSTADQVNEYNDGHSWRGEWGVDQRAHLPQEYWTVIDRQQRPTSPSMAACLPPQYFREGLAAIERRCDDKFGFVDYTGKQIVPAHYDMAGEFSEGLASVKVGQKWGVIDKNGAFQVEPQFDFVGSFSSGLAPALLGGKYGYIDRSGKWAIPPQFSIPNGVPPIRMMQPFRGELAAVLVVTATPTPHTAMEYVDRTGRIAYGPIPLQRR